MKKAKAKPQTKEKKIDSDKLSKIEIIMALGAFKDLIKYPLKASVAYEVMRITKKLEELESGYEEIRKGLVRKYGENHTKEDGSVAIPQNSKEFTDFTNEYLEFLSEEEKNFTVIKIKLNDFEDIKITPKMLANIEKFIEA